ncbi:MAG TPA: cytochrome c [Candidatus Baltobacteraceae bacterium]|nr:cytochrome c [Candidatus Baltobacteraceae bacterium]
MQTRQRPIFAAIVIILMGFSNVGCSHRHDAGGQTDRSRGAELFTKNCLPCHGSSPEGARIGPSLVNQGRRSSLAQIERAIEAPDPPMPKLYPGTLTEQDVEDIAAYVKTL